MARRRGGPASAWTMRAGRGFNDGRQLPGALAGCGGTPYAARRDGRALCRSVPAHGSVAPARMLGQLSAAPMRTLATALALLAGSTASWAQTPTPQTACPCAAYGPYPCAAVTLVALPDQEALGLTGAQLDELRQLRDQFVSVVHEVTGEIRGSQDALHTLDQPFNAAEVFALFYDVAQHEAELDEAFRSAETTMLSVLDDDQRARWDALIAEAASLQETTPECSDGLARPRPAP